LWTTALLTVERSGAKSFALGWLLALLTDEGKQLPPA
jgi:hypothetical protein